jgi:uridine kinase
MVQIIIGIAGASGSGKTTIANKIYDALKADAVLINHDAYYKDHPELTLEERACINFDHPDSLDTDLMISHLKQLKAGQPIELPEYDFTTHKRKSTTKKIQPTTVVLVEGILLYTDPILRELLDIKVFVDTDPDICLLRRIQRDVEDRGRTLSSVLAQYQETVKPMYHKFVEPSKRYADLIIPEGGYNDVANSVIIHRAKSIIREHRQN